MPVGPQRDLKRLFHRRRRPNDVKQHPVAMRRADGETIPQRKILDSLIIAFCGPEPRGQLRRRQELMINRAGRIIDPFHKIAQPRRVAQWQPEGQPSRMGRLQLSSRS